MINWFLLVKLEETLSNILVVSKVRNKILGFQFEENKLEFIIWKTNLLLETFMLVTLRIL